MISNKILLIQDGIIILTSDNITIPSASITEDIEFSVTEYGAKLTISGSDFALPLTVLTHLEEVDQANLYFYADQPYETVTEFIGCISVNRDEILKIKGAYEFSVYRSLP